jgi:hypothetical protein
VLKQVTKGKRAERPNRKFQESSFYGWFFIFSVFVLFFSLSYYYYYSNFFVGNILFQASSMYCVKYGVFLILYMN